MNDDEYNQYIFFSDEAKEEFKNLDEFQLNAISHILAESLMEAEIKLRREMNVRIDN